MQDSISGNNDRKDDVMKEVTDIVCQMASLVVTSAIIAKQIVQRMDKKK